MPPPASQRLLLVGLAVVLVTGLLVHLPWFTAPFGFLEVNAGYFFGPFVRSFDEFGLWQIRGVPLGAREFLPQAPELGQPYFNHPPGIFWAMALCGVEEWQMRLLPTIAAIASGPLLLLLLWRRTSTWTAFTAALLLELVGVVTTFGLLSYEVTVMAAGLLLWLAMVRRQHRGWRIVLWLTAVAGAWTDWSFGFFVLALLPLACGEVSLRRSLRAIALPWLAAALSLGLVIVWTAWAKNASFLAATDNSAESLGGMLERTLLSWPPLAEFASQTSAMLVGCFSLSTVLLAAVGALVLLARHPLLALTCLIPGVFNIGLFAGHAATHANYFCFLAIPICMAVGR